MRVSGGVDFIQAEPEGNAENNERIVVVEAQNIREGRYQGHSRGCPHRDNLQSQYPPDNAPVSQQSRSHNPNNRPRPPPYSNSSNH